jgi:hypothetical protein
MSRILLLIAAGASLLSAQPSSNAGGPSLGFVFDSRGQALRPILGIPGASLFGDPLALPNSISSAAIADKQTVAIMNDGAWKALTLSSGSATVLPDGLPATARVAVSENGAAAAFYDSDNNALSVVTGIPASPALNAVSLAALPGNISAFAVADDGSLLLSSPLSGGGESLFWIGAGGGVQQLASLQATASIRVWNQGANALVVDRAANQVWQLQNPGNNAAITLAASASDGVSGPSGAAFSSDGRLWVANAGTRNLLGIDMNTRATVSLACSFEPKFVAPTGDGQTFRLNHGADGPLWLLDATPGADPRVVFVPALPTPTANVEAAQ